ncbi:MAG: HD domain-containing protein [Planctomycetes bacterium]|nr:HD domain-containing protein [Planctomycetota bacterium]
MNAKTLSSPFLSDLRDGDEFEGFYVVRESSFQIAVNGKNYIRMTLGDSSGSLVANLWDANREIFQLCPSDSAIKILGLAESYRGKTQVKIIRFRSAHESEIEPDRFIPKSSRNAEVMRDETLAFLDSLTDVDYKAMGEAFFRDSELMNRFIRSPAARDVHHAWLGGLAEHTLAVTRLAASFAETARVNRDLLVLGALLHDIGKTEELSAKLAIGYTDRGKLVGHLCIGVEMLTERAAGIPGFPSSKLRLLQHLILSHHGRLEFGSPVLPKIPEAFALHHLDNLDAKVETANRLIDEMPNPEKRWTDYNRALETALYRADGRDGGYPHEE